MSNRIVTFYNCKIGDKVVRGRDWSWNNQDKGSVYGIIRAYLNADSSKNALVNWVNHKGITVNNSCYYRIGPEKFDLYFYEQ